MSEETEAGGTAQGTLEGTVLRRGTGLHTGREVSARLLPAEADRGVRFRRTDLEGSPEVAATAGAVASAEWETVLEADGARVGTPEHLLSALLAAGVDNATVEVDGPELPALDGSARPWCEAVAEAGVRRLPIVDENGTLEGIVALDDILVLLGTELGNATEIIREQSPRL